MIAEAQTPQPEGDSPRRLSQLNLTEVDAALAALDKAIRTNSDIARSRLTANTSIPRDVLKDLERAQSERTKLVLRRLALLMESGDPTASELIEKLMRLKPTRQGSTTTT